MKEYHKIQSVFKRDEKTHKFIEGDYSLPEFEYLKNNAWTFTEKVDGTNIRIMINGENITFGGKTDRAQIPAKLITVLNNTFLIITQRQKIKEMFDYPVCLYGEGYGASIQKGGGNYKSDGVGFVLFDIKIGEWWLQRDDVADIANKLGLEIVPTIGCRELTYAIGMVKTGFKSVWGDFPAEGLVLRPQIELKRRNGERIITKIKQKDFIKKGSENQ